MELYYQQLHLKYCVTWQVTDYELPEHDTIVSKRVGAVKYGAVKYPVIELCICWFIV